MIRPFRGVQTIAATSMPAFGTTLSAASVIVMDPYTRNTKPSSQDSVSSVPVVSAAGFRTGDRLLLAPKANYTFGGQQDQGTVKAIDFANNILTVQGLLTTHAAGEYLVLNEDANKIVITSPSAANPIYIGNQSSVSAVDGSVFDLLNQAAGSKHESSASMKSGEYWLSGTAGDQFIALIVQS